MITNVLIFTNIFSVLALAYTLVIALKALRAVELLEMQVSLQQVDIAKLPIVDEALAADTLSTEVKLNKRIRKLEQKDGQIQSWINTTVECFENQQDQIDTLSVLVLGKPAGDKKDD